MVAPDDDAVFDLRRLPLRPSLTIFADRLEYTLPTSKSDLHFAGDTILLMPLRSRYCPYAVFIRYVCSRDRFAPFNPYPWVRPDGSPPRRAWFLSRLRTFFPPSSNVSGHSLRSGGATALALKSTPDARIRDIGRCPKRSKFTSENTQCYCRQLSL